MGLKIPDELAKGDVVWVNFDPVIGREQAGRRPAVVVSSRGYHDSIPNIVIVLPVTTRDRGLPHHVVVEGADSGLPTTSYVMTEQPRTIDRQRIQGVVGRVNSEAQRQIDGWLDDFLGR